MHITYKIFNIHQYTVSMAYRLWTSSFRCQPHLHSEVRGVECRGIGCSSRINSGWSTGSATEQWQPFGLRQLLLGDVVEKDYHNRLIDYLIGSLLKGYQFGDLRIDFGIIFFTFNGPNVYWPGGFFGNQRIFWEWDQQSFKDVSRTSTVVAGRWNSDFFSQCHRDFFCGICGGAHRLFRRFSGRRCWVRHQGGQALFGEVREL